MAETSAYVLSTLARNWWALVLRGVIAIAFGLIAWLWPGLALYTLIVMFAVTAIAGGALSIVAAVRSLSDKDRWIPLAVEGAIGIGAGLVALIWPDLTAKTFLYIIALWAIFSGVLEIAAAVRLRMEISNEWLLGLTGLASIIFGVVAILRPLTGALAVLWLIGISSIFIGALMVMLGLRLRGFPESRAGAGKSGVFGRFSSPNEPPASSSAGQAAAANDSASADSARSARPASEEAASDADAASQSSNRDAQSGQRLTRRERALQEIVKALPPEGEGWVRGDGTTTAPDDYPYKGNVSSRIYHAPTGQSYHETVAELHFATAQDAERAGFRPRHEPGGVASAAPRTDERPSDAHASPVAASDRADTSAAPGIVADVSDRTPEPHGQTEAQSADGDTADIDYDDVLVIEEAAAELGEREHADDGTAPDSGHADEASEETGVEAEDDDAIADIDYDDALIIDEAGEDEAGSQDDDPVAGIDFDDQLVVDEAGQDQVPAGEGGADADSDTTSEDHDDGTEANGAGEELLQTGGGDGVDATASDDVPEPSATLVDSEGIGIASALDVDNADTGEASPDQNAGEEAPPPVEITATEAASDDEAGGAPTETESGQVATGAEEVTTNPATEDSEGAGTSRDEQALEALIAELPSEGEGWVRGLGDYETPAGYPVKGNASSRLYHMPGGRNYAATIPEICFATPDDAMSAGFRARSGDPTELDLSLVVEAEDSASFGIRANVSKEPEPVLIEETNGIGRELAEMLEGLPPEGNGWIRGLGGYETAVGYPVKGNASSKLYHMPGGRNYAATIAEINFATPEDAKAAGFQPRSGDPTEIDQSLVQEIEIPASLGIRSAAPADVVDDPWESLIASLPPEGTGWVRGSGDRKCPGEFPIKGNASSRIYHVPTGGSYEVTIPEFCFATPEDASSAGFRAAKN